MARLIDADKLKKDVLNLQDCYNGFSDTYDKACIIGVIDEQPTAQLEQGKYTEGFIDGARWATDIMEQKFCKALDDEFGKYMNPPED